MSYDPAQTKVIAIDFPHQAVVRRHLLESEKVELFRGVVKNLVSNAMKTLESMEGASQKADFQENYHLLHHYLDYLLRFCEGKV